MAKLFARHEAVMDRTFALRGLNQMETEVNEHFWSFKVISEYSAHLARGATRVDPGKATAALFSASGPDAHRIPATVTQWLDARAELENWLRLSALVSASSYLEMYMAQVVQSALMSDPMCKVGAPRLLDGVRLLKAGKKLPLEPELQSVTRGHWGQRRTAFVALFGSAPAELTTFERDLEDIRRLRNEQAHGFGRKLAVPEPSRSKIGNSSRLSQARLMKLLGVISKTASGIDRHLLRGFIGNFELLHRFHVWRPLPRTGKAASYTEARAFKAELTKETVEADVKFARDLIAYYDAA